MPQILRRILFILGGAVGLLVLVALAVSLFFDVNRYKPQLEASASRTLGMDFRVNGRMGLAFFPRLHVTADDVRVLSEQGEPVASTKRVGLWIELLPLLRKSIQMHRIELTQPRLVIGRDSEGRLNVERLKTAATGLLLASDGGSLKVSDGTLLYADKKSGRAFEATDIDVAMRRIRFEGMAGPQSLKGLSLEAEIACGRIRTKDYTVSALTASVDGKNGVFEFDPVTMHIFGGQMRGEIQGTFTDSIPRCQVHCALPRFRIEEFLATLSPEKAVEGPMDFTATLSMQGTSLDQMVQTMAGEMLLRGDNLVLQGNDLDHGVSRLASSQDFSLVDVGAVFFAGPMGLAVTKGYNFGSLFRGSGGSSTITTLVSDWKVERGVAHAKDVAMATTKNRIALQGGLDFAAGRYADVTIAVVDKKGCARDRQTIRGPFAQPEVEKPSALSTLTKPLLKQFKRVRSVLPEKPCEAFYSGSVAAPN